MTYSFGNALLQGVQTGQRNLQQKQELDFRREAQKALNELNMRRFSESVRQFDVSRDDSLDQRGIDNEYRGNAFSEQVRQFNKSFDFQEGQEDFRRGEYVNANINGQDFNIRGSEFLNYGLSKDELALRRQAQNAATRNISFGQGDLEAYQRFVSGDVNALDGRSFDYRFAPTLNQGMGIATDPIAQAARSEQLYQIDQTNLAREAMNASLGAEDLDASVIPGSANFIQRSIGNINPGVGAALMQNPTTSFIGEQMLRASGAVGRSKRDQSVAATELSRFISSSQDVASKIANMGPEARLSQGSALAENEYRKLQSTREVILQSGMDPGLKSKALRSVTVLMGKFLKDIKPGDPSNSAAQELYERALEEGDYDAAVNALKIAQGR